MSTSNQAPKVVDYFVVAGIGDTLKPQDVPLNLHGSGSQVKQHAKDPITDICVINRTMEESCPQGFTCVEKTPSGFLADMNHGSFTAPNIFLCYRRGRDKPPLVDLGVYYEGLENIRNGISVIKTTPAGRSANVNNKSGMGSFPIYLTYRRAAESAPQSNLVVTDVCIILTNKNEVPPYAYCLVNKNLNKGMLGSSVFLCYKKSMGQVHSITFKPDLLGRYPVKEMDGFSLPMSVPLFCLPMGAPVECWTSKTKHPLPTFSSFVLTTETFEKVYGTVISFYEAFPESNLKEDHKYTLGLLRADGHRSQGAKSLHTVKAICMLSRWPLFDAFRDFLIFIYRLTVSPITHSVPIERHIAHFIHAVPLPSPERPMVRYQMSPMHSTVLTRPQMTPIPLSGASFLSLLDDLGADNTLTVITLALLEHKMLVHSLRRSEITRVCEALITLLFPFKWQCTYVPLCPLEMAYVLEAPTPFIVGVDSRYFDVCEPPSDVVCVNLDTNSITHLVDRKISWKLLPKKPVRQARAILSSLFDEIKESDMRLKDDDGGEYTTLNPQITRTNRHVQVELTIQETVLKLMAVMMNGYREYLLPLTEAPSAGTTDPKSLFNIQEFVHKQDKSSQRFFSMLTGTQLFAAFVEARSFSSISGGFGGESAGKAASLVFFDECIDRLKGEYASNVRLIDADDMHSSERTIIVMAPDEKGVSSETGYRYTTFPKLREELFTLDNYSEGHTEINNSQAANVKKRRKSDTFIIAKRTKQELKVSQKQAKLCSSNSQMWSRLLLSHVYCVWFGCLLDYSRQFHSKNTLLRLAFDVLNQLKSMGCIPLPDETSYRILMHLCCLYNKPVLAVRVYDFLQNTGTQLSAVTYGLYNKALLECSWPSSDRDGYVLWQKLRNVLSATIFLRRAIKHNDRRSNSESSESKNSEGHRHDDISVENLSHELPNGTEQMQSFTDISSSIQQQNHYEGIAKEKESEETHDGLGQDVSALPNVSQRIDTVIPNAVMLDSIKEETNVCPTVPRTTSIVRPLGHPVPDFEGVDEETLSSENEGIVHGKVERKSSKKLVIERMDITHLAVDPLTPSADSKTNTSETPKTVNPLTPDMKKNISASDANESASIDDILLKRFDRDDMGEQTITPEKESKKLNRPGLLQRSFSFAPGSTIPGNILNSGSKLNSLLKATTIGVASKAKKLATSLAKDINETVQTNLAYYTPEKLKGSLGSLPELTQDHADGDVQLKRSFSGSQSSLHSSGDRQSWKSGTGSLKTSSGTLHNTLSTSRPTLALSSNSLNNKSLIEVEVYTSSCSKCPRCESLVYDEEIMSGWMADESNLNTHCPFCNSLFVPLLTICIKDCVNRFGDKMSDNKVKSTDWSHSLNQSNAKSHLNHSDVTNHETNLTVPYLSPLVLRKELESLLENEGISILGEKEFVDHHSIVYWNFVWYFRRLNLPSSFYNLVLESDLLRREKPVQPLGEKRINTERVVVHTLWDNSKLQGSMSKPPLYMAYLQTEGQENISSEHEHYSVEFLESIKNDIMADDVRTPLLTLLENFNSHGRRSTDKRSAYREILFFIITALGRDCIDIDAYDRAYKEVFDELSLAELELTCKCDKPPNSHARECRNLFDELDIV